MTAGRPPGTWGGAVARLGAARAGKAGAAAGGGFFSRQGLEVELPYMPPATATQALSAGSVPIAAVGGSTVTAWVGGSTELVYVAGVSNKAPYRVVARPEI